MQIDVITKLEEVKNLKEKWDELFHRVQPGLFIDHSWVYENYRCFNTQQIILVAVYGDKKKLVGVFPFSVKKFRIKFLTFKALSHGGSAATDYSQFLIDPESNSRLMINRVLAKLLELQPGSWDIFKIDNLNDNDDVANLFKNLSLRTLYSATITTEISPVIDISRGHKEAKKIANIKRRFKKIAADSTIKHVAGSDIDDNLMQKFSLLHQKAYPDSAFDKVHAQSFYKSLIQSPNFNKQIYLSYILYQEKIIAAHFGFIDAQKFYYYVPTYDEQFSSYGPGQYLLWKLICLTEEKNVPEFDFLRGPEKYKFNWANRVTTNHTLIGLPQNAGIFNKLILNLWLLTKNFGTIHL